MVKFVPVTFFFTFFVGRSNIMTKVKYCYILSFNFGSTFDPHKIIIRDLCKIAFTLYKLQFFKFNVRSIDL
jgi:hypothetical protein